MPRLLRLLLAVVLVGALGLAACGEFPFGGGSEERSMAAPEAAMAEKTAERVERVTMSRDTATAMGMAAERGWFGLWRPRPRRSRWSWCGRSRSRSRSL